MSAVPLSAWRPGQARPTVDRRAFADAETRAGDAERRAEEASRPPWRRSARPGLERRVAHALRAVGEVRDFNARELAGAERSAAVRDVDHPKRRMRAGPERLGSSW